MISTVKYNQKVYNQWQFYPDKKARQIYHIIGNPNIENYNHLLRHNIIKNLPVTIDDMNLAENIFGTNIGLLKGNRNRCNPKPVKDDVVEISPEMI